MKSIKKRIYMQNGCIIVGIVVILEVVFLLGVKQYYYNIVHREIMSKVDTANILYNEYLVDESIREKARHILEEDSLDEKFYMQVLDDEGKIVVDSSGILSKSFYHGQDFHDVFSKKLDVIAKEEKGILSVALPLYDEQKNIQGILRYATSIEEMKSWIKNITSISMIIGMVVVIITFLLSSFLARRIVHPIEQLTHVAHNMGKSKFTLRADKKYDDEVGKLTDTFNHMADEIVKSNQVKNEFISSVSHELRTPLTAIKGWSEIILTGEVTGTKDIKEGMKIISNETDRLRGLVDELLDFSKLEAKKVDLQLEKVNIKDFLQQIARYFQARLDKNNIELLLNGLKECFVYIDPNRMKQVFINIIDNAIKFSQENGWIQITLYTKDKYIYVSIEDNGQGIHPKDLEKVTKKFYKGHSNMNGSGIGLAICKEIMTLHHGELFIESKIHKGTKVILKILTDL